MLRNEIDVWMKFHRYWTSKVDIPIIVVRYEDLMVQAIHKQNAYLYKSVFPQNTLYDRLYLGQSINLSRQAT
jgi:hypothetical protein